MVPYSGGNHIRNSLETTRQIPNPIQGRLQILEVSHHKHCLHRFPSQSIHSKQQQQHSPRPTLNIQAQHLLSPNGDHYKLFHDNEGFEECTELDFPMKSRESSKTLHNGLDAQHGLLSDLIRRPTITWW
jgi:hypothetical protein